MNSTTATGDIMPPSPLSVLDYAKIRPMPDAFEILKILKERRDRGYPNIHVVSRVMNQGYAQSCGDWIRRQKGNEFVVSKDGPAFCYRREEKADICKRLRADVMIDDRLDVLRSMINVANRLILFCPTDEIDCKAHWQLVTTSKIILANSWDEVAEIL